MRAALVLSALLLVLRSPLPSLSETGNAASSGSPAASARASTKPGASPTSSHQPSSRSVPTTSKVASTVQPSSITKTDQAVGSNFTTSKDSALQNISVTVSSDSSTTSAPATVSPHGGSPDSSTTAATSARPGSISNTDNLTTTRSLSTSESQPTASGSQAPTLKTTTSAPTPSLLSTGSSNPPADTTTVTSGISSQRQSSSATLPSSPSPLPDSSLTTTAQSVLTTPTPTRTQQTASTQPASQVPATASPTPDSLMPPSSSHSSTVTPQQKDSATGTVAVPSVRGSTSLSTVLAPSTPSIHTTHRVFGNKTVRCDSLKEPIDKLLVLNLTNKGTNSEANLGSNHCNEDLLDEKLVTVLCRAVKDNFNPSQDDCTVQLGPVPYSNAVAVKHISILTNLPPSDVYESLKDQWDELGELGVSDMRLGNDGPPEVTEDRYSMPLIITIVCMASFLLLVAALYGCCHQRFSQRKDQNSHLDSSTQIPGSQPWLRTSRSCKDIPMPSFLTRQREPDLWISQRLTEELQTVENGYHDNPTLEVMETSSEMQEKKVVNLNGELGDSWIVPLDNLSKDDLDEEEDTHL
ncbi:podocalyxin [Cavia porcellus]|uniref:podocalyxin n=1 Tax=Cavia porcellus TaxID=10141 RepID=UPI002FE2AF34